MAAGNPPRLHDPDDGKPGNVLYGLAGWTYDDWEGVVYPRPRGKGFQPVAYLSRFFDALEINSSFYRIPDPRHVEGWALHVADHPRFTFTMKLWRGFTHEDEWPGRQAVWQFHQAAAPLIAIGRLGCVLVQFPWSFRPGRESNKRLEAIFESFADWPLAVEIRHAAWLKDTDLLGTLAERGAAFCNIDQPPLRDCVELTGHATAPFAYLRIHGRNRGEWFRSTASGAERYDYMYRPEEIEELARIVKALQLRARTVYVIGNNHFRGQAAANILQLRAAVEGGAVEAPADLVRTYPKLGSGIVAAPAADGEQLELF